MGLLDDAIREHLELKRLRGADPEFVSREESEVFGPVRDGEPASDEGEIVATEGSAREDDDPPTGPDRAPSESFSSVGQETVELDMRTVLADEPGRDAASVARITDGPVSGRPTSSGPSRERSVIDDSLSWEMPGGSATEEPDDHFDDDLPTGKPEDESVEDVLEETPDFLSDTPEQERLWFEQRPPRDFDFDK